MKPSLFQGGLRTWRPDSFHQREVSVSLSLCLCLSLSFSRSLSRSLSLCLSLALSRSISLSQEPDSAARDQTVLILIPDGFPAELFFQEVNTINPACTLEP